MKHDPSQEPAEGRSLDAGSAILWASAFVITALTIVQAGRSTGTSAHASEIKSRAMSIATLNNNNAEEIIAIADDSLSAIFLYRVGTGPELELMDARPISAFFPRQ